MRRLRVVLPRLVLCVASGAFITLLLCIPLPMLLMRFNHLKHTLSSSPLPKDVASGAWEIDLSETWLHEVWTVWYPGSWAKMLPLPPPLTREPPAWILHPSRAVVNAHHGHGHIISTWAFGLPCRAIAFEEWRYGHWPPGVTPSKFTDVRVTEHLHGAVLVKQAGSNPALVVPLRPLWGGLAADLLVWSAVSGGLAWMARRGRTAMRRRKGLCDACGYDRSGLATGSVCPECGADAKGKPAAKPERPAGLAAGG